jgi:hypothetical protein
MHCHSALEVAQRVYSVDTSKSLGPGQLTRHGSRIRYRGLACYPKAKVWENAEQIEYPRTGCDLSGLELSLAVVCDVTVAKQLRTCAGSHLLFVGGSDLLGQEHTITKAVLL